MNHSKASEITITCADNVTLAATSYTPQGTLKGAVILGPATGIKRQFYANFSSFLADNGYGVITFDNRGIAESLTGKIEDCDVTLQCWGEKDMPAVMSKLMTLFPNTNYHLIGHSAGGQLVGLMPNSSALSSIFNVACSSGQLSNMRLPHSLKAHFFMNCFIPISNALFGHTKSDWVGMGEPLPKKVAQQWRDWCNGEGYVKMAFNKTVHQHYYDELSIPSMWINAADDIIANDVNVDDMLSVFTQLPVEKRTLIASDHQLEEIGHMKFFSRTSHVLWQQAIQWLAQHSSTPQSVAG